LRIPLDEITGGRAAVALVTASAPVVAQRIAATSGDVASVMGLPIGPDN
jgi:alkanesulfonate monooxygenase SsuD/methylene tetrahydromethanopterin reductase-like flavin-dependent oxidoreductase (luciferase family)